MIYIAVCEDNQTEASLICNLLQEYQAARPHVQMQVQHFASAEALLAESNRVFDIYLLDIIMPGRNGIETAKELRTRNNSATIVFITSSGEYALQAFAVRASNYLLKPVSRRDLFATLDEALIGRVVAYTVVPMASADRAVRLTDIVYVEVTGHVLHYHMKNGERLSSKVLRISFEMAAADLIRDERFIRPHRSFLVNADYVTELTANGIIMDNGANIPVSRLRYPNVRAEYMRYLLKEDAPAKGESDGS